MQVQIQEKKGDYTYKLDLMRPTVKANMFSIIQVPLKESKKLILKLAFLWIEDKLLTSTDSLTEIQSSIPCVF